MLLISKYLRSRGSYFLPHASHDNSTQKSPCHIFYLVSTISMLWMLRMETSSGEMEEPNSICCRTNSLHIRRTLKDAGEEATHQTRQRGESIKRDLMRFDQDIGRKRAELEVLCHKRRRLQTECEGLDAKVRRAEVEESRRNAQLARVLTNGTSCGLNLNITSGPKKATPSIKGRKPPSLHLKTCHLTRSWGHHLPVEYKGSFNRRYTKDCRSSSHSARKSTHRIIKRTCLSMEGIDIILKFHAGELSAFVVQSEETKRRELRLRVLATEVVHRLCRHTDCEFTPKLIKISISIHEYIK